jgi:hypothetical protein
MDPQLPAPIRTLMDELLHGLLIILGDRLAGLYIGGSLSKGDFVEATSDIDFLALTRGALSPEDLLAVDLLHRDLLGRHAYASRLEGDYAPLEWIVPEGTTAPVPGCERGRFLPRVGEIMLSAENIQNLREEGIRLYGPDPKEVLPPVPPDLVRQAVRAVLIEGGRPCETAAEAAGALLDVARCGLTLKTGRSSTKTAGAAWAMAELAPAFHPVIKAALAVRQAIATPEEEVLLLEGWFKATIAILNKVESLL